MMVQPQMDLFYSLALKYRITCFIVVSNNYNLNRIEILELFVIAYFIAAPFYLTKNWINLVGQHEKFLCILVSLLELLQV